MILVSRFREGDSETYSDRARYDKGWYGKKEYRDRVYIAQEKNKFMYKTTCARARTRARKRRQRKRERNERERDRIRLAITEIKLFQGREKGEISKMLKETIMRVHHNDARLVDVSATHIHLKPVADQDR